MTLNEKRCSDGSPILFQDCKRKKMEDFSDMLFDCAYTPLETLACRAYITKEPVPFRQRYCGTAMDLKPGSQWAEDVFDCAWFHITGTPPANADANKLVLLLNCGGEGLLYDSSGNQVQSITCYAAGFGAGLGTPVKRVIPLYDCLLQENQIDFWIDCGANDLFGDMEKQSRVQELSIGLENKELRALAYDVQVLLGVYDYGNDSVFKDEIETALDQIMTAEKISEDTAPALRRILKPLMAKENASAETFTYSAIGHAHLDLAWLWPIRESKRKGARTFATQIKNIERYPDYVFGASQAQLYQWIKDGYPDIYSKVKALAKTPNWDVQGSTWVEMDSNLISGESMVRQFYYGKKFFKEEFDQDMKIFWVPDSFGYSGCLPQVMQLSGVPYFLTQKISWNIYTKFPYHSFYWQGIDGTKVLAHMLPEDTYNAPMRADLLTQGEKNYREREISDISMSLFGIGDGGAGPGYEHLERAHRQMNLNGLPKIRFEKSMDFFSRLDNQAIPYPTFSGELYLERHQGTYTTRTKNKYYNRKCEFALKNYEMLIPIAENKGCPLPVSITEVDAFWKEILLYQFHDILPGSSINRVYEECEERYKTILQTLQNAAADLLEKLIRSKAAVNFNPFAYRTKIKLDNQWYTADVPALGYCSVSTMQPETDFHAVCGADFIENDSVRVTFRKGVIVSLYNKQLQREFAEGEMGQLSQYTDNGDCWDIENCRADYIATKKDAVCTAFSAYTDGAKAGAVCEYVVDKCKIRQEFYILDNDSTVYATLDIDAHQEAQMLRIAFPTKIQSEECKFNIQFGHIARRTTENTLAETAQFEVSGHKFVDLSDNAGGISLLNDCKYGFRCKNGVMDMNLVRSPKGGPGIQVDQGMQHIKYALFTHKGTLGAETYKAAYLLNNPLVFTRGADCKPALKSFYTTDNDNVVLETIKPAADGNGIIARFYNSSDQSQSVRVELDGYTPLDIVNIPEERIDDANDGHLSLHRFELVNIRFVKNKKN